MVDDVAARYEYDAFISYNRKADGRLAAALHDALHRFAKPWWRLRARRVFRDDDTLGANAGLWHSLERALAASRFLVLLAGEGSANSVWVARELEYWCREREPDSLIVVATDPDDGDRLVWSEAAGDFDWERTTALPPALRGQFSSEPRIVDLAWARGTGTLTLDDPAFRAAVADIVAPISGRPKDELIGEDVRQHRRTLRWVRSAVATLAGLLVLAVVAAVVAVRQRDVAQDRAAVAEARQYAAQSLAAADPYAALGLAIAAEQRTAEPLPEARSAYAAAVQRAAGWTTRPIAQYASPNLIYREMRWSPGGDRLRAAGDDGSVIGWQLSTGAALPAVAPLDPVFPPSLDAVAWFGESTLAVQTDDTDFVFRDLATGRTRGPFPTPESIGDLAFSRDGTMLAVAIRDGVQLWDVRTARLRATLAGGPIFTWRAAFSPDGTRLVVAGEQGLWFWDVPHRRLLRREAARSGLWSIAWHPSGSMVVVGADNGELTVRDGRTGAARYTENIGGGERVADLAWAPDGNRLAAAGGTDGVRMWTLTGGYYLNPYGSPLRTGLDRGSRRLAWSPDGRMVAAEGGIAGAPELDDLHVWAVAPLPPDPPVEGLAGTVRVLEWAPAGDRLAAEDASVTILAPGTSGRSTTKVSGEAPTAVAWSPRGDGTIALAAHDGIRLGTVSGTGLTAGGPLWNSGGARSLAWAPGGDRFAAGDERGLVTLWAATGGKRQGAPLTTPVDGSDTPDWLTWSPDGTRLSAGLTDGRVIAWDDGVAGDPWTVAPGGARAMAWSPDGTMLATVARDGTLRVWSVPERELRQTLSGIGGDAAALAWSPDGTRLAAAGYDGRVRIWQASGGALLAESAAGPAAVTTLDWSPDGTRLAAGADTGAITLYTARPERSSCALVRAAAGLTPQTREQAGAGLSVCAGTIRDLPPLPVVTQGSTA